MTAIFVLASIPEPDAICRVHSCVNFAFSSANIFSRLAIFFPPVISMQFFKCPGILSSSIYYFFIIWIIYFPIFFLSVCISNHELYNFNEFLSCPTIALHALATGYLYHLVLSHLTLHIT